MDIYSPDQRSKVMASVRSRENKTTELRLTEFFRKHRIVGWRRHQSVAIPVRPIRGRAEVHPDFIFRKSRIAVFVDGCFWHGCSTHCSIPATRSQWWNEKIAANRRRDARTRSALRRTGWKVIRIWEHELSTRLGRTQLEKRLLRVFAPPLKTIAIEEADE